MNDGAFTGLSLDGAALEFVTAGDRIGARRLIAGDDMTLLAGMAARYVRAVRAGSDSGAFAAIGRELYTWLDGDQGQLRALLARAARPVVFEVRSAARAPSREAWAVLRAPLELLAEPEGGFLADDALRRFSIARRLGQPAVGQPLGDFRLGLAFMASSPRGVLDLDFEAEEAAILRAVGETRMDLLVDDTGDPRQLADHLAGVGGMPVVHLSCHGLNNWRESPAAPAMPALLMETDEGAPRYTTAADLAELLTIDAIKPRLLFVSACLTATDADADGHLPPGNGRKRDRGLAAGDADGVGDSKGGAAGSDGALVAHSLATALIEAGLPAVLGWDGSVDDRAATLFAEHLYAALAGKEDLAVAVGNARRKLLNADDPQLKADWHLARLWLGPGGGGSLVAGTRKRSLVTATHGTKTFLKRKQRQVPVATAEMFVGRRAEMQQALRALRSADWSGVLLHGQGRLGKSSLAARIADRLAPDYVTAVVFGDYTALGVLDAITDAVSANAQARDLVKSRLPEVRQDPAALEAVLLDLLAGPCAQRGDSGQHPLLLIVDDLEQILAANPDGPHRVVPTGGAADAPQVLAAVLRAFDLADSDSRLLFTSRYTFALNGQEAILADVQLRPLSGVAQHKLRRRQQTLARPALQAERAELADRAVAVSRGNPGLQDLIVMRLVYNDEVPPGRAEAAVASMESYLAQGDLPAEPEIRAFLENLALDTLLDEAGVPNVALLRAITLFDVPVPESVVAVLAAEVGGSPGRLRGLGLLDPYPDLYDPSRTALRANPLAAGRLDPLSDDERTALAVAATAPLFGAWGGEASDSLRERVLDLQLARLALRADDPAVVASCAAGAVDFLRSGTAETAAAFGRAAIDLLDRHTQIVPVLLLRQAADAVLTSGDGETGDALLTRAVELAETVGSEPADPLDLARALAERADHLITRGELTQAEHLYKQARELFTRVGSEGEAAATWGQIAEIAYRRGDYEEALRIWREVELPVYERLGDVRSAAVTWGRVADIAYERGDYEEALRIRREVQLPVYERLGDVRSAALTWGKVADIAYERGDYEEALRILREVELPVLERLGEARSAAVTWGQVADIAFQRGDYEEALRIRRDIELPVYERLGDARETAVAWGKIADIAFQRDDYEEALRILREVVLPAFERLGDVRSGAVAWGRVADIAYERGDYEEALRIRLEVQLPVYERLGDARSAAVTWGRIAHIAYQRGDYDQAAELHIKRLEVNRRLGDLDGIACASHDLASIDFARDDYQSAFPRLLEAFQGFVSLGRPDGIASAGIRLGKLLIASGQPGQARLVLDASNAAAAKLGWADAVQQISELFDSLPSETGET